MLLPIVSKLDQRDAIDLARRRWIPRHGMKNWTRRWKQVRRPRRHNDNIFVVLTNCEGNSLVESSMLADAVANKRRTSRVAKVLPVRVTGVDALQEPFVESTFTVTVSCNGCKYQSKHYVPRGSIVTIEIPRSLPNSPPRVFDAEVIWVQRPRNTRDILHIGLDFAMPGNVWDIPSPPADWFPLPGEPAYEAPKAVPEMATFTVTPQADPVTTTSWDEQEILAMADSSGKSAEPDFWQEQMTEEIPGVATDERIEPGVLDIDGRLRSMIEETIERSITRVAASITEDVRKTLESVVAQLDVKIQQAVDQTISTPPTGKQKSRKKKSVPVQPPV